MNSTRIRRYPGLNYFTTEQKAQFFGRDDEKAALLALVLTEKIVALFGKSGYGKSSLLRAGLIPELPEGWLPLVVQLGAYQAGQSPSPLERTRAQLEIALPTDAPDMNFLEKISPATSLWKKFKQKQTAEKRQFLLIFDQFEEFQTYPQEQREDFKRQLAELLFTRIPQAVRDRSDELPTAQQDLLARPNEVRAIFAIREDRLSVLDGLADKLPAILHKRFHLKGLDDQQATAAIVQPARLEQGDRFESPKFEYAPAAVAAIKRGLKKDEQDASIESFLLQICCEEVERGVIERAAGTVTERDFVVQEESLPDFKDLFEKYYRNKIAALPDEPSRQAARRMMEDHLVKTDPASGIAYRINVDGRTLCSLDGVDEGLLKRLTDFFLLRSEPNTTGGFSYEVSHDRLVEGILVMKKEWDAEEAERKRIADLAAEQKRLREQAAAQAREQEKIRRDRQRNFVFSVGALLLLGWAVWQTREANRRSEEARVAEEKAQVANQKADDATLLAKQKSDEADSEKIKADAISTQAELDRKIAEQKTELAKIEEKKAKTAEDLAKQAQIEADIKKLEAEKLTLQVVANIIAQARKDILELNYDAAFEKMKNAAALNAIKDSVAFECMEVAFFHHHTKHGDRSREPFDLAARLLGKTNLTGSMDFETLNTDRAKFLKARYFHDENMVAVKGGTFQMQGEKWGGDFDEYEATAPDFQLSKYETTVWQYNLFCVANGRNITQRIGKDGKTLEDETYHKYQPAWGWIGNHPVVFVSWYDAVEYANWRSDKENRTRAYTISFEEDPDNTISGTWNDFKWTITSKPNANGYRLPTEIEWEFAAKGGSRPDNFIYSGDDKLDLVGWFGDNSDSHLHSVGRKKANGAGVFDMSGNVWEWCFDWYGKLPAPTSFGAKSGTLRVLRGGSWVSESRYCRAAHRIGDHAAQSQ